MTLLVLVLSIPAALAADCAAGDSAAGVLALLDLGASQTLTIGPDCDVQEALAIQGAADLTINCAELGCELPPIAAYDSTLRVVGGQLSSTVAFRLRSPYDVINAPDLVPGEAGIYAERSFLDVEDVDVADLPSSTAAVFAWDSEVSVLRGRYERLGGGGIVVLSRAVQIDVSVTDTYFEDIAEVGLRVDSSLALGLGGVGNFVVDGAIFAEMVTADGDIAAVVDSFSHADTRHYRSFAKASSPVTVSAASVTITDPEFVQTHGEGSSATFFIAGADEVSVERATFQPAEGSNYSFKVFESGRLRVNGGLWEPMNTVVMSADTVAVTGVRFRLPERKEESTLLASAESTLSFTSNTVCAEGPRVGSYAPLFDLYAVQATFDQNVFQKIELGDLSFMEIDGSSMLTVTDNSFVNVGAKTLVDGALVELDFRNNLLYETSPVFQLETAPAQLSSGFNLLSSTLNGHWPSWWPVGDEVSGPPVFIDGYSPNCEEAIDGVEPPLGPAPADGSPVIDAGDPALPNSADDTRSDIGAVDFSHPVDEPDDPGAEGDSGDSGDSGGGGGGGGVDLPGEVQYGGGCAFGGWGIAAAPLALLWRRRRPGAAMRR